MRYLLGVTLAAATVVTSTGQGPASRHWSDEVRRVMLDNGLTILLLQRGELPIVSVQALYRFGSRNEHPGLTGSAHFIEHMAFRSTDEIAKQDLTNQVLRWGGRWNGYTSYDQTVYGSHTPSEYLEWLIYLERQRMRHVRFDPDEVERERTSVIAEEHQYRNSPVYEMVEHRLRRAALVAHPYGSPIMGRLSDLEGVTARELERFYREHYAPNNLVLGIVGRFDPEQAVAFVRRHFADVPADGEPTAIRTREPPQRGERRVTMKGTGSEAHLSMLVHAPAASDGAFATLLALDGVLAGGKAPGRGTARPGSRLYRAFVESGLASSVSTEVELSEYPGLYEIRVDAPAGADLAAVEARLDQAIAEAAAALTQDEIAPVARQVRADLAFAATSNRAVANLLTVYEQMRSYTLLSELPRRLDGVTADRARAFARDHLARDRRTIGLYLPDKAVDAPAGFDAASTAAEPASPPAGPRRSSTRPIPPPHLEVPALPAPVFRTLSNGLIAAALPMPGESAHMRVRLKAGAAHDPKGREGTALLTARLLTAGSAPGPAETLADRQVRLVSSALQSGEAFANREFIEISATLFPDAIADASRVLARAITEPVFDDAALARTKRGLAAVKTTRSNNSRWRADRGAFEALYAADQRYGRPPEGTAESLAAISREDVTAFHRVHYRPEQVVVVVAGAIDPVAALTEIERAFGTWRPAAAPPTAPAAITAGTRGAPAAGAQPTRVHIPLDKVQASLTVALPGISRDSDDFAALSALNYLLGETGYAGRLGEVLVDTGISYSVYATFWADRGAGPVLITTDAVRSREAADLIVRTLDSFARNGVTEAELREAKGYLLGRLLFRFESPQAATATLAEVGYFAERTPASAEASGLSALRAFARRVLALTVDNLNRAARKYYDPSRAAIVIAGR